MISLSQFSEKEIEACKKIGCQVIFNVGGGKIRSSSELLKEWENSKQKSL